MSIRWPCLPWKHDYIKRFEGGKMMLECMRCLHRSPGIEVRSMTFKECSEIYEDMMQVELSLHGGG